MRSVLYSVVVLSALGLTAQDAKACDPDLHFNLFRRYDYNGGSLPNSPAFVFGTNSPYAASGQVNFYVHAGKTIVADARLDYTSCSAGATVTGSPVAAIPGIAQIGLPASFQLAQVPAGFLYNQSYFEWKVSPDASAPEGAYPFSIRVSDGVNSLAAAGTINVDNTSPKAPTGIKVVKLPAQTNELVWQKSIDNFTADGNITYNIYLDGVKSAAVSNGVTQYYLCAAMDTGSTRCIVPMQSAKCYGVSAMDEAGNESAVTQVCSKR